jgi:hypothetical protein
MRVGLGARPPAGPTSGACPPRCLYWPPDERSHPRAAAPADCAPDPPVNAEFNWWLLIVGLVAGAGLVWLVLADSNRRESEILEAELPVESAWIADALIDEGDELDPATVARVLRLHRAYLAAPPPDEPELVAEHVAPAFSRAPAPAHGADGDVDADHEPRVDRPAPTTLHNPHAGD